MSTFEKAFAYAAIAGYWITFLWWLA